MDKYKRDHSVIKLLQIVSAISFILCVVFIILLILSRNSDIQLWYSRYLEYLASAEYKVEHMSEKFSVFLIVIFLYAFKAVFPIYLYPVSALCAVTSAVFPSYFSIPINLLGLSVLYSVKYFWGTKVGANGVQNILQKSETVRYLVERDGRGNPWLLALFRLIRSASFTAQWVLNMNISFCSLLSVIRRCWLPTRSSVVTCSTRYQRRSCCRLFYCSC